MFPSAEPDETLRYLTVPSLRMSLSLQNGAMTYLCLVARYLVGNGFG